MDIELYIGTTKKDLMPGEFADGGNIQVRHRSMQNMVDLADVLGCHLVPQAMGDGWVTARFCPRNPQNSWHHTENGVEKYGADSPYQRIQKLEDPSFLHDLRRSLVEAGIEGCQYLMNLGVNTGDELTLVQRLNAKTRCLGIDHSPSAIAAAKARFAGQPVDFLELDINNITTLDERHHHRYDIFMSLGTLHSPGVDSKRVFMWCMQHLLAKGASVIVGFPNCRWVDGEPVYGARTRNRRETDMSLVIKDTYFIKKYLQQHKFQVTIFGRYYLFVVGRPIAIQR